MTPAKDINEPIDASKWVSANVVVQKKDDGIRIRVDPREPNKAIIPDQFSFPTQMSSRSDMALPVDFPNLIFLQHIIRFFSV